MTEALDGVDRQAAGYVAGRRAYQFLLWLDSDQQQRRAGAIELMQSTIDIPDAVFLLSAVRRACLSITSRLPQGQRTAADARIANLDTSTPRFRDPGQDDDFLFVQLRGTTMQWALLALDHADQVWPDPRERAEYLADMARIAYELGD